MTINYSSTSFIPYFIPYSLSSDYPNLFFTSVPLLVYDWRENQTIFSSFITSSSSVCESISRSTS